MADGRRQTADTGRQTLDGRGAISTNVRIARLASKLPTALASELSQGCSSHPVPQTRGVSISSTAPLRPRPGACDKPPARTRGGWLPSSSRPMFISSKLLQAAVQDQVCTLSQAQELLLQKMGWPRAGGLPVACFRPGSTPMSGFRPSRTSCRFPLRTYGLFMRDTA